MLAEVLRRLPPRYLAVCRGVCRNWRIVVDADGLLLASAHLLPRPMRGIFIHYVGKDRHSFFSRPAAPSSPGIDVALRFLSDGWRLSSRILDHSNGLLLCQNKATLYVCNPATRRYAPVPSPPVQAFFRSRVYIVFDPTVTLHYNVLYVPDVPNKPKPPPHSCKKRKGMSACIENLPPSLRADYEHDVNRIGSMEWPPRSYAVQVFSSRTNQWEEKRFIRVGDSAVTVSDVWSDPSAPTSHNTLRRYTVYWREALYVHCRGGFIVRFSLLKENYLVIKTPEPDTILGRPKSHNVKYMEEYEEHSTPCVYIGKSKLGLYYTALHGYQLQVWVLHEASDLPQMSEWELKHQANLGPLFLQHYTLHHPGEKNGKSWILDHVQKVSNDIGDHEWDSGDDSLVDVDENKGTSDDNWGHKYGYYGIDLLGYHHCKEIAFLGNRFNGFAYYLDITKLEYLGSLYPPNLHCYGGVAPTIESFIYTPCMDDQLFDRSDNNHI